MLRSQYYHARAEKLRFAMLTTSNQAAVARLRGFVERYRLLAERAMLEADAQRLKSDSGEKLGERSPRQSEPDLDLVFPWPLSR
jgi:hypothetical protein